MNEYKLQPAALEDLEIVLSWVRTPESLKLWGGPALTFPPLAPRIWQEMNASPQNTFSFVDQGGNIAGFGQIFFHEPQTVHLARIIVSPAVRGKGVGRLLCQQLIRAGITNYRASECTLNVYKDNAPAVSLYLSLGFTIVLEDPQHNWFRMSLQLDRQPATG